MTQPTSDASKRMRSASDRTPLVSTQPFMARYAGSLPQRAALPDTDKLEPGEIEEEPQDAPE